MPGPGTVPIIDDCSKIAQVVDAYIADENNKKVNTLPNCNTGKISHCCDGSSDTKCVSAAIPQIQPCISIKWGDSKCDCIETNDFEIMCITVCNCYTNITFKNFEIASLEVRDSRGYPVATLPDGTPSVELIPRGPYCFGDIGPCTPGGKVSNCVSREFVVYTRGAIEGSYKIVLSGVCFDVYNHYNSSDCFSFNLCKD